uniref:Uncharacterized protein n=1 Tax=Parascaris univalens TaxID=6257 RepID=A0A915BUZ1_PARUN
MNMCENSKAHRRAIYENSKAHRRAIYLNKPTIEQHIRITQQ